MQLIKDYREKVESELRSIYTTVLELLDKYLIANATNSAVEKAMAPHSSTLAWKVPWTEETGRLQSMGSLRVGHD